MEMDTENVVWKRGEMIVKLAFQQGLKTRWREKKGERKRIDEHFNFLLAAICPIMFFPSL